MLTIGAPITIERLLAGSCWQLFACVNGFAGPKTDELVTQAAVGRSFQVINDFSEDLSRVHELSRLKVRFLEDGYHCWIDLSEVMGRAFKRGPWEPQLFTKDQIQNRVSAIISWLEKAKKQENQYLWGGTIGPDFDCSGLVQSAFSSQQIWLPRDAYQQESFCENIQISLTNYQMLRPGDLLFFGTPQKCNHVAIYIGDGMYCHSSGIVNGRNGIGFDGLHTDNKNSITAHYLSQLRGAGRVVQCHDGMTLP